VTLKQSVAAVGSAATDHHSTLLPNAIEVPVMPQHNSLRGALVPLVTSAPFCLFVLLIFNWDLTGCAVNGQTRTSADRHSRQQHPQDHAHHQPDLPGFDEPTSIAIPDITLTDQDNRKVTLYKDLMKGKLVLLSFFYTTCEGICPTSAHWLSKLQDKLGDRLGKDVIILSVTMDPETDTPEKLSRWGKYWKRKPGWTLLTSRGNELRELMKEFKPYPARETHSATVFVGDGTQNPVRWVALDILSEGDFVLNYLDANGKGVRTGVEEAHDKMR
jgi:protein SCO1/2